LHDTSTRIIAAYMEIPEMAGLPLRPGDTGDLVTKMQTALVDNGFSVGSTGADGSFNNDTLKALESFQDGSGVPVQPFCDLNCWRALHLPGP
jgi:peptidoglycan hydrolase-like protein with peptidoglycan-binding domain